MELSKVAKLTLPVLAAVSLAACNSSSNNDNGDQNGLVDLKDGQIAVYYRLDNAKASNQSLEEYYQGWTIHGWNDASCNGWGDGSDGDATGGWDAGMAYTGINETYGAYWVIDAYHAGECINMIPRNLEQGGQTGDLRFYYTDYKHGLIKAGDDNVYVDTDYTEVNQPPVGIVGASAHWVRDNLILWDANGSQFKLYHSANAGISVNVEDKTIEGGEALELNITEMPADVKAQFPHLAHLQAYELNAEQAAEVIKGQLVAAAYNQDEEVVAATLLQIPGALDDLYWENAKDEPLGAVIQDGLTTFRLWAPTAKDVNLALYDEDLSAHADQGFVAMEFDPATGIWSSEAMPNMVDVFYRYQVEVYHPNSQRIETLMVTDPYSLSLSANSTHSQVVDLQNDSELFPNGWDSIVPPTIDSPTDYVLYETQVRDFSFADEDGNPEYTGKYLAFTDEERASYKHLMQLRDRGLNNVHLLPVFDIATVDEVNRVDIDGTIGELCELNANAGVCEDGTDKSAVIEDVLQAYVDENPATEKVQALVNDLRQYDSFNWGYDPFHFNVPEGSYATDAHGKQRILEFRQMVKHLHQQDMRVIMDVVYNHTHGSGPSNDKSVLDKIVPGYYQRLTIDTGVVENSTCCDNTATEHKMMGKLMVDSLIVWARDYQIDGFRFDLMGHQPKDLMIEALEEVQKVSPDNYFYGEGWTFGEVQDDARFVQANQLNMAGTGIGTFSDRLRDGIRGGSPFDDGEQLRKQQGFANAVLANELNADTPDSTYNETWMYNADLIRVGMAGNLADFQFVDRNGDRIKGSELLYGGDEQPAGYTESAQENISYVSKHDNQTLWDINQYKLAEELTPEQRARMQTVALSTVMTGQGIPFIHMGSELLRSKSMERDSYDSGDWYNRVDFTAQDNNWNKGLPMKHIDGANYDVIKKIIANPETQAEPQHIEDAKLRFFDLMEMRTSSTLFRMNAKQDIMARIDFHNTGVDQIPGVIVQSIDNGIHSGADLDSNYDAIVVMVNATAETQQISINNAQGFELHPVQQRSTDLVVKDAEFADGTFEVPAMTTAVFVQPRLAARGDGLPVKG
ncbi:pullulanase [Agarivorans sp. OAG1]|uniref:pullulanase-type alpha-1,6-glucosidase n=1 Tax=Agarivorans sp. OAG1 TaxID=3082387 RepID=UPI002B2B4B59|nr:pullulanase [Agarivorans sp. OAG1]